MIGEIIKALRVQKGFSQKQLAIKSNLHQCQISKIESGSRKVTAEEISIIAKVLDVSISELLYTA